MKNIYSRRNYLIINILKINKKHFSTTQIDCIQGFKLCIIKLKHGEISVEAAQRQMSRWNQFDRSGGPFWYFTPPKKKLGVPQKVIRACFGNTCSQVRILLPRQNQVS
jgi:hypothetical protein